MKLLSFLLLVIGVSVQNVDAAEWHFLRWVTPNAAAQFYRFSMEMTVPPIKHAGGYFLWPGIQHNSGPGVLQQVLDGRKGSWWIGSGWCCGNPTLPWGSGFSAAPGNKISISNTRVGTGGEWHTSMRMGSSSANGAFDLGHKNFNQALLTVELQGPTWDFGPLKWNNVVMVMKTTETAWCTKTPENYGSSTRYSMSRPRAVVSGGWTTSTIDEVVLLGPA